MAWGDHRWTVCYANKFSGGSTLQAVHVCGLSCSESRRPDPVRLKAFSWK